MMVYKSHTSLNYSKINAMDSNIIRKFRLIIWKNFIIRKRHWVLTCLEIIIPILLFILMAYIRGNISDINRIYINETTTFPPKNIDSLTEEITADTNIFYTNIKPFYGQLMNDVRKKIALPATKLHAYMDEEALLYNYTQYSIDNPDENVIVIIFNDKTNLKIPKNLKYSIRTASRWETELMFPSFQHPGPMNSDATYFHSGFVTLQSAIDECFIAKTTKKPKFAYEILLQRFPYPPYMNDMGFTEIYNIVLPVLTVISFLFLCPSLLKRVVEEKQTGIKELMKLMGLQPWMLWLGWLIHSLVVNIFSITIIVLLMKVPWEAGNDPIIPLCNGFLLWLLLVLYVVASVCFFFFISTWFSRPTIAMSIAMIIWINTYFAVEPFTSDPKLSFAVKLLFALFPNICVLYGYQSIATFEVRDVGLKMGNIFEIASGNSNDLSMGFVYLMLIFDIAFYSVLTWYVDNIRPGQYGLARPWYFPFMKSFWIPTKVEDSELYLNGGSINQRNYEEPPKHLKAGITIKNLRKTYGNLKAVDGLSVDIYNGEITALLGHNGAGKTTTMSILTGMFAPTSGEIYIHDYNIRTQLNQVRDLLGLCPQHNMLFTDLTVLEHLIFFARLKGKSPSDAKIDAENLLTTLNLPKANNNVDTLSGGMKRKLSLGIALIGDAQVLMLDEPTSGMDPEARREVWDLLLRMRGPDKVIMITTHFMEEADVLGDRIAIMDHGKLQCFGTSMFLKKQYGAGYQLSLIKADENTEVDKVVNVVNQHIPNGRLKHNTAGLLTFTLPTNSNNKFPELFQSLESAKSELHISGIGLSVTTLEEVFLRVGEIVLEEQTDSLKKPNVGEDYVDGSEERLIVLKEKEGLLLEFNRFAALLTKKYIFTKRKYILFPLLCIIPILMTFATITLGVKSLNNNSSDDPPLTMDFSKFGESLVYYKSLPANTDLGKISQTYGSIIQSAPNAIPKPVKNVNQEIVDVGIKNIAQFREMIIVGAEFNQSKFSNGSNYVQLNAMYSTIAFHGLPISLNMITNSLLKFLSGKDYSITTINHPLEKKTASSIEVQQILANVQIIMLWFIIMPLGYLFLVGGFINFPLVERVSKAKQLQLMTGLKPYTYWFSSYLWDFLLYFIVTFIVVFFVIGLFDSTSTFNGSYELATLFSILILYGLSSILYSYFVSFFRETVPGAFSFLLISSIIIGIIVTTVTYAMTKADEWKNLGNFLQYLFSLIPHYAFSLGLLKFSQTALDNNKCRLRSPKLRELICQTTPKDVCCTLNCTASERCLDRISYLHGDNGIWNLMLMLAVDVVIYFGILMLIDYNVFSRIKEIFLKRLWGSSSILNGRRDSDVERESDRVNNYLNLHSAGDAEEDNLLVHGLERRYRKHPAVRGISFGVHSGECFGLLGVNGAGKTTTFRMLTGDEIPTRGDALANHYKLSEHRNSFVAQLGYCPQFDAINESLTGREMLQTFARLRGIPSNQVNGEVNKWLALLGLTDYADRLCGTYSGGNKRKLSTAMALIAEPPIVLLDEPTSGVDPISRRNLWNVLSKIHKQSIVLTSHSMEECEALCNRLAIMVNGQFQCIGTVQYLKQRFGQGFTIQLKIRSGVNDTQLNNLKTSIEREFICELKDEHEGLLHYHVTNPQTSWYHLFNTIERLKSNNGLIEDYTISETTLEQVFLSFARQQRDENHTDTVQINGKLHDV